MVIYSLICHLFVFMDVCLSLRHQIHFPIPRGLRQVDCDWKLIIPEEYEIQNNHLCNRILIIYLFAKILLEQICLNKRHIDSEQKENITAQGQLEECEVMKDENFV